MGLKDIPLWELFLGFISGKKVSAASFDVSNTEISRPNETSEEIHTFFFINLL